MNDMRAVIIPKSDQLTADELQAGPLTITIESVVIRPGTEQPVTISYGDDNKPYKPCKLMCRVMVECWGPDANAYTGKSMTLYRDPGVKWGGLAVGGIRISHITDIPSDKTMALQECKGSKKPFKVRPLMIQAKPVEDIVEEPKAARRTVKNFLDVLESEMSHAMLTTDPQVAYDEIMARDDVKRAEDTFTNGAKERFDRIVQTAINQLQPQGDADPG